MRSYFLESARQGHNHFSSYLLSMLVVVATWLIAGMVVSLLGMVSGGSISAEHSETFFSGEQPVLGLQALTGFFVLGTVSLLWAEEHIHHRHPRGLFGVEGRICLQRLSLAALLGFGMRAVGSLVMYLAVPAAYNWNESLTQTLKLLPFILISSLAGSILFVTLLIYLSRALSLILHKPLFLVGVISVVLSMPSIKHGILSILYSFISFFFLLYLFLRDDRIELGVSWLMADSFYSAFVGINYEDNMFTPLITVDESFWNSLLEGLSIILFLVRIGIFCYCFLRHSRMGINHSS